MRWPNSHLKVIEISELRQKQPENFFGKDCWSMVCSHILSPREGRGLSQGRRSSMRPLRRTDGSPGVCGANCTPEVLFTPGQVQRQGQCLPGAWKRGPCAGTTLVECCMRFRCGPSGWQREGQGCLEEAPLK